MKGFIICMSAFTATCLFPSGTEAFVPVTGRAVIQAAHKSSALTPRNDCQWYLNVSSKEDRDNDVTENRNVSRKTSKSIYSIIRRRSKAVAFALATATSFLSCLPGQTLRKSPFRPLAARASAPIVLRAAKTKDDLPMVQALKKAEELKKRRSMEEFDQFMQKCNDIEDSDGKRARDEYEKQYHLEKVASESRKEIDLEKLKRDLLDEGKDPSTDLDAERQVFLFEHDIDLEKIPGTPQNEQMIKIFQSRGKNIPTLTSQRYIVKCQVADLKARGIDPLMHFSQSEVVDKTRAIYKMDNKIAAKIALQYESLMEKYGGRLTEPKEGEVPFERSFTLNQPKIDSSLSAKELRAERKAAAKAKRIVEKDVAKRQREAQKLSLLESKQKAKADRAERKDKELSKKQQRVVSMHTPVEEDGEIAATAEMDIFAAAGQDAASHSTIDDTAALNAQLDVSKKRDLLEKIKSQVTIKNVGTIVIGSSVAVYGINYYKENNSAAQKERERQLKLIMGFSEDEDDDSESDSQNDVFFDDDDDDDETITKSDQVKTTQLKPELKAQNLSSPPQTEPSPSNRVKPKRKLGIFSKRSANGRESDLNVLLGPNGRAPELSCLIAKILSFGAPGRFPAISSMGDMPFDEFQQEKAREVLSNMISHCDVSDEESAEIFASVVNCMIIDIIDLASSALKTKDKDEKLTIDAINVVMDFMDHAASLFDAVAKNVTITPVKYGGNLRKKELEQMYSIYAGSAMMSLNDGVSQDRVDTLQLVFDISDKKAEGLMQKNMMKVMMNLLKDGGKGLDGMPGMEEIQKMMATMGGTEGIPEMLGLDGEMSPEDLKQTVKMMKDLMDSGQVSKEELAEVRKQFKDLYGSDIADLIMQADKDGSGAGMGEDEKELLNMFRQILGET